MIAHASVTIANTSPLIVVRSWNNAVRPGSIDTEGQPSKNAILDVIRQKGVLHERVYTICSGLFTQYAVGGVFGEFLGVGGIRFESLDLGYQVLVEEGLSNMACVVLPTKRHIGKKRSICVNHNVDMRSSAGVMAGKDGLELGHTITVGLLDPPKPRVVDVAAVGAVAVAGGNNAGVHPSGVAMPHLEVDIRNWIAGVDVDHLIVKDHVHTFLTFDDIFADVLSGNICQTREKEIQEYE